VVQRYAAGELEDFLRTSLTELGLRSEDAAVCAEMLLDADLRGVGTHGIANFVWHLHYGPGLRDGYINPRPRIEVLRDAPVAASWDADRGFGPLVAHKAMTAAVDKAAGTGVGMVTVRNGCHFGAHAYLVEMAAARDMVGMSMTHTSPAATAPNGLDLVVGTNPIGIGVPSADDHNFVLDMSTTAISGTKALFAERTGTPLPPGVAVDSGGRPTTDASERVGLLPLGSTPEAGAGKGLGLALVVDMISGVMSGTGSGLHQSYSPEWCQGYWFLAWRVDLFTDPSALRRGVAEVAGAVRSSRRIDPAEPVRVPGDRGAEQRRTALTGGIALPPEVGDMCRHFAADIGVPFPEPMDV
jgi:LDH2 family malate/lactate/ureidoglycolate dehydrogenase